MRVRRLVAGALAAVMVVGLVACGADPAAGEVVVTGATYERPTITFDGPLKIDQPSSSIIWPGSDAPIADGEKILVQYRAVSATDGAVIGDTYDVGPQVWVLSETLPMWIYETLRNAQPGSRILRLEPGSTTASESPTAVTDDSLAPTVDGLVVVFDVLPMRAEGEAVAPAEGLPTVTLASDGAPTITIPEGATEPTDYMIQPLVKGAGPQVHTGQLVTVQYTAVYWTGEPYDSTWGEDSQPATFQVGVGLSFQGMDEALVEQTVGSQLLMIAPESKAYKGKGTLVFVIDILAVSGEAESSPTAQ